jgi:hypothetical protein
MYHRIGNSALETTGISAESYELAKDVAVTAASATAAGKVLKTAGKIGKAISPFNSIGKEKSPDKTQNTSDNNNQNESTHNNLQDIRNKIADSRSAMSNYML